MSHQPKLAPDPDSDLYVAAWRLAEEREAEFLRRLAEGLQPGQEVGDRYAREEIERIAQETRFDVVCQAFLMEARR